MAKVELFVPFVLDWEGGIANNKNDKGGYTNMGVTIKTWKSIGYDVDGDGVINEKDLAKITKQDVVNVLKKHYWDKCRADEINNQAVANILAGWAWGSGATTSIKQSQKALGLKQDGVVGSLTLSAINNSDAWTIFNKIWLARKTFFVDIVKRDYSQIEFLSGWLNRLYDNVVYSRKNSWI